MAMIAEALRKPADQQRPSLGPSDVTLVGKRELVYVFDYNEITKTGTGWIATLPLVALMDHLPITCRYTPNIRALRFWGALGGLLLGIAAVSGVFYSILSYYAVIMGFLFGAAPGALAGWISTPHLPPIWFFEIPKPFWVVRRVWAMTSQDGDDEDPELFAQFNEGWRRYVIPAEFDFLADGAYVSGDGSGTDISQSHELVASRGAPGNGHRSESSMFLPVVHRATSLYENLQMRVYKAMHKRSLTGWQKVQIASVAVLAGVALAALIFVVIVTSDEQPAQAAMQIVHIVSLGG